MKTRNSTSEDDVPAGRCKKCRIRFAIQDDLCEGCWPKEYGDDAIEIIRTSIDNIDRSLVSLLNKRAEAAKRLGRIKKREGKPIKVIVREAAVMENVCKANEGPLTPQLVRDIFRVIIDACIQLEED